MTPRPALLLTLLIGFAIGGCTEEKADTGYALVWQDEFEGPAGQLPDSTRWQFDLGTDWGNKQLEYDTNLPSNVSLDGEGNLAITARREKYKEQEFTSGRIKTKDLFEKTYGRFEARIKVPIGQGIWPAFWMLGENIDEVPWPACGEIDILEYRGHEPLVLHGSIHGPGHAGGNAFTKRHTLEQGGFNLDFHEFAVEWEENQITWFIDGVVYHTATPADLPAGSTWVYDHPYFILLNVAVGGGFPGSPDDTTVFPQTMLIDYVRVYHKAPAE